MAGISFEEASGNTSTKPSGGITFEEATRESKAPVEGAGGAAFGVYPRPGMEPGKATPTTSALGAFGASAAEAVAATPGVMAGARMGSAITPPITPFAKPIGGVVGGVVGAVAMGGLTKLTENFADTVFGTNISATREAQQEQHPYASLAGQVAGGMANPWMRPGLPSTVKQGLAGSGIMTVVGATQRAIQGGDPFDPLAMTVDATMGGFSKPTARGERLMGQGAPVKPETKPGDTSNIPKPPESATPEEKQAYLQKLEATKAERDSKAPLVETAIRNKTTGKLERMGPKHDQARKDDIKDNPDFEEGFIDERGNFHERLAAVDQAKRSGQIPEDHVLESPPDERPGLHSGDLRKVGDKRFEVTDKQPAGKPFTSTTTLKDGSKTSIETESSPNAFSNLVRAEHGEPISLVAKNEAGEEIGRLTYMPDGGPIDVFVKEPYRRKGVATALYEAHKAAGGKLPDIDSGVAISDEARAVRASMESKPTSSSDELAKSTTETVAKAAEKVDVKSIPNEEEFYKHATDIYEKYGESDAVKFFEDYKQNLNERSIPVPNTNGELDDALHKFNTFETKDSSEHVTEYERNTTDGITAEDRKQAFDATERGEKVTGKLGEILEKLSEENLALVRKIKALGGDVGDEFTKGQSRIRLFSPGEKPGWAETVKKFFSNDTPMGDKVADQANAAIERKVYQLEDGRVVEIHRQPNDIPGTKGRDIKKGTEIWEWKDGMPKRLIGHTDNLEFKRGDKINIDGKETTMVDGKVDAIEQNSPYRYLHDAEASARLANMGLRKMARELEFVENLKKSELFKQVGHGPDQPLKDLPREWVVPNNIDRIPQLRGWHFDPKTAAIISDFAKVWDNTMWMKLSNALVKNMMLNPVPHMFNEVMHLWNARGFTGWVDPRRLGTFADTSRQAWRDVGQQTQFYRDIMREGGSILGADPRNKGYFDTIVKEASKEMFGTEEMKRSMGQLAKKLGTTTGNLYNSISEASQKAMWFTRDVMYVQYIREIMNMHEKRTGNRMELKEAIAEAERHMPNYRMPSEVAGSRMVAQVLKNPNVSMFSRYHYGMVKSLVNTLKDIDPRNLKTSEGRKHFREGVDSMLAIGVAMGVLYPLMDKLAESMFGEGAEQRRAGPYHLIQAAMDAGSGKKDASALLWPVFTFNPVLLTLGQLLLNKKVFTGKEIYHPDDSLMDKASDVGSYMVKQIPQVSPVMDATQGEGGGTKFVARQLDIKAKTEKEKEQEARAKKYQERTKKGRDTKRAKGTYNP